MPNGMTPTAKEAVGQTSDIQQVLWVSDARGRRVWRAGPRTVRFRRSAARVGTGTAPRLRLVSCSARVGPEPRMGFELGFELGSGPRLGPGIGRDREMGRAPGLGPRMGSAPRMGLE